jgi:hypothetical protein
MTRTFAIRRLALSIVLLMAVAMQPALAREASFVEPSKSSVDGKAKHDDVVYVQPDSPLDVGETIVGVTKRVTLFFNNSSPRAVKVSNMTVTADGNVRAELVDNDCTTLTTIPAGERCSVGVSVTPNSPGPWTTEVLMVHDAPGRVSQAAVMGTTAGEVGNSGQQPGLSLLGSTKDQLIDFGQVEVGVGRAVRTILLINDSPNPLKIATLDLVAADRGLTLLEEGGCTKDLEIAAGSSCPVTVMWQPLGRGDVSTDLIIRHSGPVGFAVIPVRGQASGGTGGSGGGFASTGSNAPSSGNISDGKATAAAASLPTGGSVPSISAAALFAKAAGAGAAGSKLVLRGTVGQRAILADSGGAVVVAGIGESVMAEGVNHKVVSVTGSKVVLDVEGTKIELSIGSGVGSGGGSSNGSGSAPPTPDKKAPPSVPKGAKTMKSSDAGQPGQMGSAIGIMPAGTTTSPAAATNIPVINSKALNAIMGQGGT